ncbi:MAG: type I restriction enzyme HsdR N-terminal domain-containing protein [Gemmatimonadales bacterium]
MSIRISKRFLDRAKAGLRRYQKILASAKVRDVNESDTVVIVSDFLAEVLGYDKYSELTTEFAIRSTFCDLAVKVDGRLNFLIEVKSAGTDLKENHLRQCVDYGAKQGTEWVILTNGSVWQAHRIRFEQPIQSDLIFTIDLLDPTSRTAELLERLYLISRESATGSDITKFAAHREATSRFVVARLLLTESILSAVRREMRRLSPGLSIATAEVEKLLREEVLKREALEGERAESAESLVKRAARRRARAEAATTESESAAAAVP